MDNQLPVAGYYRVSKAREGMHSPRLYENRYIATASTEASLSLASMPTSIYPSISTRTGATLRTLECLAHELRPSVMLWSDDISPTVKELRNKGVEVRGDPEDEGRGISTTLVLPGGYEDRSDGARRKT